MNAPSPALRWLAGCGLPLALLLALLPSLTAAAPGDAEAPASTQPVPAPRIPATSSLPPDRCAASATPGAAAAASGAASGAKLGASCCCSAAPLVLELPPVTLPSARVGKAYPHRLKASGGTEPYSYQPSSGDTPPGLKLKADGGFEGLPTQRGSYGFSVQVRDAQGRQAQQAYRIQVLDGSASKPAAPASAVPAAAKPLTSVSPAEAQAKVPAPRRPQVEVFRLLPATLKQLIPTPSPEEEAKAALEAAAQAPQDGSGIVVESAKDAPKAKPEDGPKEAAEGPPAPGPLDDAQIAQLTQLLTPLLNVEYPTQALFEAALDAQLCQFVAELTRVSAAKRGEKPPSSSEFAAACPVRNWGERLKAEQQRRQLALADPARAVAAAKLKPANAPIAWQDLAPSIMSAELRAWLIERSGRKYPLNFSKRIQWDGAGCGCVQEEIEGQIYGFFPDWWSSGKVQQVDFSRLHRVSIMGLAFNDDGSLAVPEHMDKDFNDFVSKARVHGTELDLTLYRDDWAFLKQADRNERDAMIERLIREVPARARGVIDKPLDDWLSRLFGLMPGLSRATKMGDGITLFLDRLPPRSERAWREQFDAFYKKLVEALIATLRRGPHEYTLNLVISDQELAVPGAFELDNLFDYLRQAEEPTLVRGRIHSETAQYKSNTNVTLRFVVLLSEPTGDSKKALRVKLDQSTAVRGGDRRIFLRKLIPMVSPRQMGGQSFGDDLIYYDDNYGGVAFWPMPIKEVSTPKDFDQNFDTAFLGAPVSEFELALRGWVCEHRWALRALFELLLLIGAGCWLAMALNCNWRARFGRYMPLGALPPLLIGGLLFKFDPALKHFSESPVLLWTLLAIVTVWAVLAMRRTQVEKP